MRRTFVVAEMACSHEGSLALAHQIIDTAGKAGADAIQFQVWRKEEMAVPYHPDYPKLARLELSVGQWQELADHSRRHYPRMQIMACVYGTASVDFCRSLGVERFKIHSADLSSPELLAAVAATGKPIHLSIGASRMEEIAAALEVVRRGATTDRPVTLMYGYQNFPTRPDDVHLRYGLKLATLFECPLGFQDHSGGDTDEAFWLPAAAIGAGATVIEKHLTHDRAARGIDYEAALDPAPFHRFVAMVRAVDAALGTAVPHPFSADEEKYRKYAKKTLVVSRDLPEGTPLEGADLVPLRAPELGLSPDRAPSLVGKRTRRALAAFEPIALEDLQ